ncbi:MAG: Holliday junction resolvase RecU [Bacilli bacterium]|nr:Holliday junction resolvase RecU [Bacilli bacterium]
MLYPNNNKKIYQKNINYANRGMKLEALINEANEYYKVNDIAIIYKKPTPITISKINYESDKKILTKGFFKNKSTLDYVGLYKGYYLDFDAKSTTNKTSLPLNNIHNHQIKHIESIIKHGGIAFLIIEINKDIFLLKGTDLLLYIKNNNRKSIPFNYIKEKGLNIKLKYNPTLDYIKIISDYLIGGHYEKEKNYQK